MSKMGNYVVWCEEKGYTNDMGEVDSMDHVDEYMKQQELTKAEAFNAIVEGMKILKWGEEDDDEMSSLQ